MKNKKILTVVSSTCLSLVLLGAGVFALFSNTQTDESKTSAGSVSIDLVENFPSTGNENGENTDKKDFWGVATGSKKSLARAHVFVSIEAKNADTGKWEVLGNVPSNAVTYDVSADGWKKSDKDGYYYYQKVLEGNPNPPVDPVEGPYVENNYTTTQVKITNVKVDELYAPIVKAAGARINMLVTMENCQATNYAYELSWENCDTSCLPPNVARK